MDGEEERQPLVSNQPRANYSDTLPNYVLHEEHQVPPIGPDELPPSYNASSQNGAPLVTCRVCQAMIDISEKRDQHVVKCSQCLEATPIRNAPPGKKYVRCPCNCLLICKTASQRIACPRPNCKRIINLTPSPVTPPAPVLSDMSMVTCAHCGDTFLFRMSNNLPARCPHCRRVSSVGGHYSTVRATIFGVLAVLFLALGIIITLTTFRAAAKNGGIYVVYVGAFILSLLCFGRCLYFVLMKTSYNRTSQENSC